MSSDQRLSVTFGAFSCDVVGYDNPFTVLNKVVEAFSAVAKDNPTFAAGGASLTDMERARVAAELSSEAARVEELADATVSGGTRYVVSRDEDIAAMAAAPAEAAAPVAEAMEEAPAPIADVAVVADVAVAADENVAPDDVIQEAAVAEEVAPSEPIVRRPLRIEIPEAPEPAAMEIAETEVEDISEEVSAEAAVEDDHTAMEEAPAEDQPTAPRTLRIGVPINTGPKKEQPEQKRPRIQLTTARMQKETGEENSLTEPLRKEPTVTPAATPESAERTEPPVETISAAADQKRDEEGDNFLFADVTETESHAAQDRGADSGASEMVETDTAPALRTQEKAEETEQPKRSLRSLAGFLGFKRGAEDEGGADDAGFNRLQRSLENASIAASPTPQAPNVTKLTASPRPESLSEAMDFDDESSPAAFARRVGANSLQDLLEVSAVYMSLVEGKSKFSRRDVMQALHQIGADKDYSQEARLKSFRKLLTSGSLVRVEDGLFAVSQATRFGYETQLQA